MSLHVIVMVLTLGTSSGGAGTPPTPPPILVNSSWMGARDAELSRRSMFLLRSFAGDLSVGPPGCICQQQRDCPQAGPGCLA